MTSLHKRTTKFVLLVQGRSGSKLLLELLNAHPAIHSDGEIFFALSRLSDNQKLNRIIAKIPDLFVESRCQMSKKKIYGFVLMDYHLAHPGKFLNKLFQSGWKIIYLTRNDLLAQCFSNLLAQKTKLWHRSLQKQETDFTIDISINELLDEISWWVARKKNEERILQGLDYHSVVYEDSLQEKSSWPETTREIFKYLGADHLPVTTGLLKTYSRHYSKIINNFDNLMDSLRNTAYAHLVSDSVNSQ